jgi:hypothetical protein
MEMSWLGAGSFEHHWLSALLRRRQSRGSGLIAIQDFLYIQNGFRVTNRCAAKSTVAGTGLSGV